MLTKENYTMEHIRKIRGNTKVDQFILERSIYALGLLEALAVVRMPFIFKGGTCLMLLLDKPRRLSTDIDIIVEPGTDVGHYLNEAAKIFPFRDVEQQLRKGKNNIEKQHYKFTYDSPVTRKPFYILLDILYEKNHYSALVRGKIRNDFIITEEPYKEITLPSVNCILGDKLTAFAPHTTGILFGSDKELEIVKQMYDIAVLTDVCDNFEDIYRSYMEIVASEIAYRGLNITYDEVLLDTIEAAACIAGRGNYLKEEYPLFLQGIKGLVFHVYGEKFSREVAAQMACKVMYIGACILKNTACQKVTDHNYYLDDNISGSKYSSLSSLRRLDAEAFAYLVKTIRLLQR